MRPSSDSSVLELIAVKTIKLKKTRTDNAKNTSISPCATPFFTSRAYSVKAIAKTVKGNENAHQATLNLMDFLNKKEGTYKGKKFNVICHFFGYQARGSLPSKFDCDYAYVLGHICYHILDAGLNGYLATVTNLKNPVNKWRCGAAPITAMMTVKRYSRGPGASSIRKPVVHPATFDLKGKAYEFLRQNGTKFLMDDAYRNPGPLQFDGPGADTKIVTLCVEDQDYMGRIKKLQEYLDKSIQTGRIFGRGYEHDGLYYFGILPPVPPSAPVSLPTVLPPSG